MSYYRDNPRGRRERAREHAAGMAPIDKPPSGAIADGDARMRDFTARFPIEGAWLSSRASINTFAASLVRRIRGGLPLTQPQLDALKRCAARSSQ